MSGSELSISSRDAVDRCLKLIFCCLLPAACCLISNFQRVSTKKSGDDSKKI